jgi:hypothetical protein
MAVTITEVVQRKVWLIIGEQTGLHQATTNYLETRGQEVIVLSDLDKLSEDLACIAYSHDCIDMLIINDLKKETQLELLLGKVYTICDHMRQDGTSQVVFMLSNELCFSHLKNSDGYKEMEQKLNEKTINVRCFEPC